MSRGKFLKETLSGAALLAIARCIPNGTLLASGRVGIPSTLSFFSLQEYLIFEAVAERIIGPPPPGGPTSGDIGVAARADTFLSGADPEVQEQIHQLLTVFNAPFFTFLFDFRFSSFINMSDQDRDSYLLDWMTSMIGFRRTGFQALKRISLSMFYTENRAWTEIGYEGMFLPEERK